MCGQGLAFYQFIDYTAIYGPGAGTLCYRVEPCAKIKAIQNSCGPSCCRPGPDGEAAFASLTHNYNSNNGPGPWLIATLDQVDPSSKTNYGVGEHDLYPCALRPTGRDINIRSQQTTGEPAGQVTARWSAPGFQCDPSTCTSAPVYPGHTYGCYRCDEVGRVAYVQTKCAVRPEDHMTVDVYDSRQRWQTDSFAACARQPTHARLSRASTSLPIKSAPTRMRARGRGHAKQSIGL